MSSFNKPSLQMTYNYIKIPLLVYPSARTKAEQLCLEVPKARDSMCNTYNIKQRLAKLHDTGVKIKKVLYFLHILIFLCFLSHFNDPCNSNQPIQTWQSQQCKQISISTSRLTLIVGVYKHFKGENSKNVK
jgi:hypothetical protein